ncbi:MAG: hypothetical protein ACK57P_01825, partial [Planctomycetota bacterium]
MILIVAIHQTAKHDIQDRNQKPYVQASAHNQGAALLLGILGGIGGLGGPIPKRPSQRNALM